ncbi:MAG: cell division protein FtsL [Burkholderiaceae bacterium]
MTRVSIVLLIMLLASSVYLVRVSYESRHLFAELDRARAEERSLSHEQQRLLAEKQAQATPLRVEKMARDKLAMRSATPAVTLYVSAPAAVASAPSGTDR